MLQLSDIAILFLSALRLAAEATRRLAAILAADVARYSRLMGSHSLSLPRPSCSLRVTILFQIIQARSNDSSIARSPAKGRHPWQILVGEYGVAQPSHNTLGDPLLTSPAWFSALHAAVDRMGFAAAAWDLDSGFGITCGEPGVATLCTAYKGVFP
jgi:hypothetical protein